MGVAKETPSSGPSDISPKEYWDKETYFIEDVKLTVSKANLVKLMQATISCHAAITSTYVFGSTEPKDWSGKDSLTVSIKIPKGLKSKFEKMTGWELRKPPKLHLN